MIYEWVAYGNDIEPEEIIIKMDGIDINDSQNKTVQFLINHNIYFDTCEPYDDAYRNRAKATHS